MHSLDPWTLSANASVSLRNTKLYRDCAPQSTEGIFAFQEFLIGSRLSFEAGKGCTQEFPHLRIILILSDSHTCRRFHLDWRGSSDSIASPRSPKTCFGTVKLPSAKRERWFAQGVSSTTSPICCFPPWTGSSVANRAVCTKLRFAVVRSFTIVCETAWRN